LQHYLHGMNDIFNAQGQIVGTFAADL